MFVCTDACGYGLAMAGSWTRRVSEVLRSPLAKEGVGLVKVK